MSQVQVPPAEPKFKLDGVQFFCTWPRTGESWDATEFFNWIDSEWGLVWCRIALEAHQDGAPHVHAAFKTKTRVQTTSCRIFDYKGRHGKYEALRKPTGAAIYFEKEDFVDYGPVPRAVGTKKRTIDQILPEYKNEHSYMVECCNNGIPYQYAIWFKEQRVDNPNTIGEDYQADITRERFDVCLQELVPGKSNVFIGPSGIGKTSWAKRVAPKPALWVRHLDVLRQFKPEYHKSVIFDDMSFAHVPREAQIDLLDCENRQHVHVRYKHVELPAGITKIFTANTMPFIDPAIDEAIARRMNLIFLV